MMYVWIYDTAFVGLFGGNWSVGLFCGNWRMIRRHPMHRNDSWIYDTAFVGLFGGNWSVGLFCGNWPMIRRHPMHRNDLWIYDTAFVGLFCGNWSVGLFCGNWRVKRRHSIHRREWRRFIGCLKLQVFFRKRATNYRALLRKITCEDKASYGSTPPCNDLWRWWISASDGEIE